MNNYKRVANGDLSKICSMRVGGTAKEILYPYDVSAFCEIIETLKNKSEEFVVLGYASNVIFTDEYYDGSVIITSKMNKYLVDGCTMTADAGTSLMSLVNAAQKESLSGLEFAYGIPGSVGGAVYMNAGAYGGETSFVFERANCLLEDGTVKTLYGKDLKFSYRHSALQDNNAFLLNAVLRLIQGEKSEILSLMETNMKKRMEKQPLDYPSCGSFFKRPEGNFAGTLIEKCGLKGFEVGGAAVSDKHAGFVINKAGASVCDILKLAEIVTERVFRETGITLVPEVKFIHKNGSECK